MKQDMTQLASHNKQKKGCGLQCSHYQNKVTQSESVHVQIDHTESRSKLAIKINNQFYTNYYIQQEVYIHTQREEDR